MTVSALHFYERRGLIQSVRTTGNQRRYDREAPRRVALIQVAQGLGIPLAEVNGDHLAAAGSGQILLRAQTAKRERRPQRKKNVLF